MFQSPRIASSRQLVGIRTWVTQLSPLALGVLSLGTASASAAMYAWPAGLRRLAGILLLGKAAPVSGSRGAGPHTGLEKSPVSSAAVGTQWWCTLPRLSRFHSSDQKKYTLSFLTGPPTV